MLTKENIQNYLADLAANGATTETIRAYRNDLEGAHRAIDPSISDWSEFEKAAQGWLNDNRATWSPKTTVRRLGTVRSWAKASGAPASILAGYKAPKPSPPQPHPIPEGIDGVVAMIRSSRNPRHRALCALTGLMGLRVGEAIGVRPEHFSVPDHTLTVRGKGDKTRVVPVSLAAWAFIVPAYGLASKNGGTLVPLTNRGARAAITRHARNAHLSRHVASHDMRATFATAAYGKTKNLRAVQELLGHADAKTTQVYTGVSMADMREAADLF